ncbi:MAG: hypothetical protein AAF696_34115 [Bacteroidota bacterium]
MNLKINRALVSQRNWDSGSITPLSSIFHNVREKGEYQILILEGPKATQVAVLDLLIDNKVAEAQLELDLFALSRKSLSGETANQSFSIHPKSNLLFFCSRGNSSYAVIINEIEKDCLSKVFDSRALTAGDAFLISPLVSGKYVLSAGGKHKVNISVNKRVANEIPNTAVEIACTDRGFTPKKVVAQYMQPIVVTIKGKKPCRLTFSAADTGKVPIKYPRKRATERKKPRPKGKG